MTNPILAGFYPDPSMCVVEGRYYLANSSFEYFPAIPLHVSDDFVTWTPIGHAVDRPGQIDLSRAADSGGLYAPALRYHRGVFYLVCTSVGEGEGFGSFYLTATDPAGDWSDPVFMPDARGFDPSLFFDGDSAWWIECREREPRAFVGDTEVWMRQIDLSTGTWMGEEHIVWEPAMRGGVWAEGPHIHRRGDWYYLLAAEGGTAIGHAVVVGRSTQVTGPYVPNPHNPIITHRHLGRGYPVRNVGHADFAVGDDGQWRAVMLGSRQIDNRVVLGRETFAADVTWENDWPVINAGSGVLLDVASVPLEAAGEPARVSDFIVARGPQESVVEHDRGVAVASVGASMSPGVWRRLHHQRCVVSVEVELLDAGAIAGVALRQSDAHQVAVEVGSGRAVVCEYRAGIRSELGSAPFEGDAAVIEIVLSPTEARFSVGGNPVGSTGIDVLTTEVTMGFVGTVFGVRPGGPAGSRVLLTRWSYNGH